MNRFGMIITEDTYEDEISPMDEIPTTMKEAREFTLAAGKDYHGVDEKAFTGTLADAMEEARRMYCRIPDATKSEGNYSVSVAGVGTLTCRWWNRRVAQGASEWRFAAE